MKHNSNVFMSYMGDRAKYMQPHSKPRLVRRHFGRNCVWKKMRKGSVSVLDVNRKSLISAFCKNLPGKFYIFVLDMTCRTCGGEKVGNMNGKNRETGKLVVQTKHGHGAKGSMWGRRGATWSAGRSPPGAAASWWHARDQTGAGWGGGVHSRHQFPFHPFPHVFSALNHGG